MPKAEPPTTQADELEAPTPTVPVRYGLLDVAILLQLQACPGGATAVARSGLNPDGRRGVRVWLNPDHLLVTRALHRADAVLIRFLIGSALVEYCDFWRTSADGRAVKRALTRLAGIEPEQRPYGSGFASRLAASEAMRTVDSLPIFTKTPPHGPFDLLMLSIEARTPSDIRNWMVRDDEVESVRPIPKSPPKPKPAPAVVVPEPDPFLSTFHDRARELLSTADYDMLVEMTKEEARA